MQCSTKSSTSVGRCEQFYPSWNKFLPPWSQENQGVYSPKSCNAGNDSFQGTSSLSSESYDEMESTDLHPSPTLISSPLSSISSTPKIKVKINKLKFGVDAILESSRDKKARKEGVCRRINLQTNRASDFNCLPLTTASKNFAPSNEISENDNESLSKSAEQLELQSVNQCLSNSCSASSKSPSIASQSIARLFRPAFPYQMSYHSSHIPSFIPLLFAPLSGRQRVGMNAEVRLAQYLTQQHAYQLMTRSRTFHENAQSVMNSQSSTNQLFSGSLKQIPSNLFQPSFTNDSACNGGFTLCNYPATTASDGSISNNLPSTTTNLKKKRSWSRAVFSNLQRKGLEKRFEVQKYVTKPDRRQLAAMLGLTDAQVKVWFQNRRMKWRHLEEAANHKKRENLFSNLDENGIQSDVSSEEIKNETSCEFPDDEKQQY